MDGEGAKGGGLRGSENVISTSKVYSSPQLVFQASHQIW